MKKYITGGLSEQEARELLFSRGVKAFMALGGQNAQKGVNFEDLPALLHAGAVVINAWDYENHCVAYQVTELQLKTSETSCFYCVKLLNDYIKSEFGETIQIYQRWTLGGNCCFCGELQTDDIPF